MGMKTFGKSLELTFLEDVLFENKNKIELSILAVLTHVLLSFNFRYIFHSGAVLRSNFYLLTVKSKGIL